MYYMTHPRTFNKDIQFPINLFVYGTLKTGGRWNTALGLQGNYYCDATVKGFELTDIIAHTHSKGGVVLNYPVMEDLVYSGSKSKVKGEILVINNVIEFAEIYHIESGYDLIELDTSTEVEGHMRDLRTFTYVSSVLGGHLTERVLIEEGEDGSTYTWSLT